MAFFPLAFKATITRQVTETNRSGQVVVTGYSEVETIKCLFLTTSGNKRTAMREDFEEVLVFYAEATADIDEGDRIIDIKNRSGVVVEEGPFEVLSVKKVANLSGSIHHLTCKLKGLA